jgi:hypothetical protein
MKLINIIFLLTLTGCSTQQINRAVCYGAGTCGADAYYAGAAGRYVSPLPQTIITNQGTYMIINNQSTGSILSINQVSRGK